MSSIERVYNQLPRPKLWRRAAASTLDFLLAWLLSAVGINPQINVQFLQILIFVAAWLLLRVVVVARNQGQSLGHWAFDMKVVDAKGRVPSLLELSKREGLMGLGALLAIVAAENLGAGLVMLMLLAPLIVDCGWAWTDPHRQTLHDLVGKTLVVHTYRGFSLDRKIKRFVAQNRQRMR